MAEVVQIRARSGDRAGPGPSSLSGPQMPYLGEYQDFKLELLGPAARAEQRVIRVWQVPVLILHQSCEIDFADSEDSRLTVAPIVAAAEWPEAPWDLLRQNVIPGYFFLPELDDQAARRLGLPAPWAESVAVLANCCVGSVGVIKSRRIMSLTVATLPGLHDAVARFWSTRGMADLPALSSIVGKRVLRVVETGMTVGAPSPLIKVYFDGSGRVPEDSGDEGTYAFWGVRRPADGRGA